MNRSVLSESTTAHRFLLLDGLRGVAALMVLGYHLFEAVAFAAGASEQLMYNGFLAVDFFFILSGFVMGYAYDKRWGSMSLGHFVRLRLIRLHPMVVMGVLLGLVAFCLQGCQKWDGTLVSPETLSLCLVMSMMLLPAIGGTDVRGNTELFPLNGPHWSLFFEYIGNLLYAVLLHRLKDCWLAIWVGVSAIALAVMGLTDGNGHIGYGWSSQPANILGGLFRLSFAYPLGLLLWRLYRKRTPESLPTRTAVVCALVLTGLLMVPSMNHPTLNLLFQLACITIAFPSIIWIGARTKLSPHGDMTCSLLGNLSYPLYAVHYPLIYLYIHWINIGWNPFGGHSWMMPIAIAATAILIGWVCSRFYDIPVRKWLKSYVS